MRLFKNRTLNIAILASAAWHIIFAFSIAPVLLPGHIHQNHAPIIFLGSILDRVTIGKEKTFIVDKFSLLERVEKVKDSASKDISLTQPEIVSEFISPDPAKEQFLISYAEKTAFKITHKKELADIRFSNFLVKGSAKDRIILYRPNLPKAIILPSDFNAGYSANIKFKISRHGFVESPECITSSGSSEIDQMAIRYIRKWFFVPECTGSESEREGIVRVSFN